MFCTEYSFSGSFDLSQFVENPAPIIFWYRFGKIGLLPAAGKKLAQHISISLTILKFFFLPEFVPCKLFVSLIRISLKFFSTPKNINLQEKPLAPG